MPALWWLLQAKDNHLSALQGAAEEQLLFRERQTEAERQQRELEREERDEAHRSAMASAGALCS